MDWVTLAVSLVGAIVAAIQKQSGEEIDPAAFAVRVQAELEARAKQVATDRAEELEILGGK